MRNGLKRCQFFVLINARANGNFFRVKKLSNPIVYLMSCLNIEIYVFMYIKVDSEKMYTFTICICVMLEKFTFLWVTFHLNFARNINPFNWLWFWIWIEIHKTIFKIFFQVFILVGAGIVGGVGLIIVEIIYHKHKIRRAKRTETAKIAFTRWKGTIEVKLKYSKNLTMTC